MRNWGIYRRLLFLAVLPALVATGLFAAFNISQQLESVNHSLTERGLAAVRNMAPASEYGVISGNRLILNGLAMAQLDEPDVVGVAILSGAGEWLLQQGTLSLLARLSVLEDCNEPYQVQGEQAIIFCAPVVATELPVDDYEFVNDATPKRVGTIFVEYSLERLFQKRNTVIAQTLLVALIVMLITVWLAALVSRQLATPLVSVVEAVNQVARGNMSVKTEQNHGGEIGALQRGLNEMIIQLRRARENMEMQIDVATAKQREALHALEQRNTELERERKKAQEASEAKSLFLATMSHEIRTPISGMLGMIELLDRGNLDSQQSLYLQNLQLEARVLKSLIDDILDLSRIEADKMELYEQPFDIETPFEEVLTMMAPAAHEKGIELVGEISANTPKRWHGDQQRLRQVLINLVGNAVKFTDTGFVLLKVEVNPDRALRITISDTGIGMPLEKQQLIFESFTQVDSGTNRRYGGSGLGTTISKRIVDLMQGDIGLKSSPGEGTTFTLTLPLMAIEDAPVIDRAGAVLLFEQTPVVVDAATKLLQRAGFEVEVATAREQIAESLHKRRPDWLIIGERSLDSDWGAMLGQIKTDHPGLKLCHLLRFGGKTEAELFDLLIYKPLLPSQLTRLYRKSEGAVGNIVATTVENSPPGRYRALVVEDSPINALALRRFAEDEGCRVVEANDGSEALEALRRETFDVVFMDMRMPGMDGIEATRLWRAEEGAGHTPIIAITANATEADRSACLEAGMDDFLTKPVTPEQVRKIIEHYIAS